MHELGTLAIRPFSILLVFEPLTDSCVCCYSIVQGHNFGIRHVSDSSLSKSMFAFELFTDTFVCCDCSYPIVPGF
jgi:hypothetical protein